MLKIEKKLSKFVDSNKQTAEKKKISSLEDLLVEYEESTKKMITNWRNNRYQVTNADILEVVSDKTNIPIDDLKLQDFDKVKLVKTKLKEQVFGQDTQIEHIYKSLIRAKAGFRNPNKPICSMLYAGPTGVGKTMTAKIIAETLFVNKNNFITIDMSEYTDKTAVNKLVGSSPGYIGFDKGGVLTEKVRKNPYSLILFDEIQKADQDVLYSLLQILEEGKITDSSGKMVDFSNTMIVMTTNIGAEVVNHSAIGFGKQKAGKSDVLSSIKKHFPPDLLNRIDEVVIFDTLEQEQIKLIIDKELQSFKTDLSERNVTIKYSSEITNFIFNKIQFNNFGARQVIKTIQRELQTQVAEKMLDALLDAFVVFSQLIFRKFFWRFSHRGAATVSYRRIVYNFYFWIRFWLHHFAAFSGVNFHLIGEFKFCFFNFSHDLLLNWGVGYHEGLAQPPGRNHH